MAEEAKTDDSMEDILHSIRDIISDEDGEEAPTAEPAEEEPKAEEPKEESEAEEQPSTEEPDTEEEILELTEEVLEQTEEEKPEEEQPEDVLDSIDEALEAEPEPEPKVEPTPPSPTPAASIPTGDTLLEDISAQASTAAMQNLVNNIPQTEIESPPMRTGPFLEDLVIEAMRPMLSEWLNENLPDVVEKLVEKEIRKIVPRD